MGDDLVELNWNVYPFQEKAGPFLYGPVWYDYVMRGV